MRKIFFILAFAIFPIAVFAQETNAFKTEIEAFEAQTNILIVKGFGLAGSLPINGATLAIYTKESSDVLHGQKIYGLNFAVTANQLGQFAIVDEDELAPLADALDYLSKITYDVTALPAFDAEFAAKSGLRFGAHSSRKQGGIQYFLQFPDGPKISLTTDQLAQFKNLLGQARDSINALKK